VSYGLGLTKVLDFKKIEEDFHKATGTLKVRTGEEKE
jgi:hypothetical protein